VSGLANEALAAIFDNIISLRVSSFRLYRRRNFPLATHIAIICGEECAKYLFEFCKEYLSPDVFKKRFQHLPKYRVLSAPWYIAGMLEVTYLMHLASRQGVLGDPKDHNLILEDLLLFSGQGSPQRVAEILLQCLERNDDPAVELQTEDSIKTKENHRRTSVYVDVDDNGRIVGRPSDISKGDARRYLRDLIIAVAVIRFVSGSEPDIFTFVGSLPRDLREPTKQYGSKMITKARAAAAQT
jgi:hypothetical protein